MHFYGDAIRFPRRNIPSACLTEWRHAFARLIRACDFLPFCHFTFKVILTDREMLPRTIFFEVPADHAFALQPYIESFKSLEDISSGSIAFPSSHTEYNELFNRFPRKCLKIDMHNFVSGDAWLACDYHVFPFLDELVSESTVLGYDWTYQANIYPSVITADTIRNARRNFLNIEALPGASSNLVLHQETCVENLNKSSWVCDEFLGADNAETESRLRSFLRRRFTETYGGLKFPVPSFEFNDEYYNGCSGMLNAGFDVSSLPPDKLCAAALDNETVFSILSWQPTNHAESELNKVEGVGDASTPPLSQERSRKNTIGLKVIPRTDDPETTRDPVRVFISYSHKDEELKDELLKHLRRDRLINCWHDRKISGGTEWAGKIDENLNAAHIVLLLISVDFLDSDYCYGVEMARALERHDAGKARVIPILLRPVDWSGCSFAKLQAFPRDNMPVTAWPNRDQAFVNISKGIRSVVRELLGNARL